MSSRIARACLILVLLACVAGAVYGQAQKKTVTMWVFPVLPDSKEFFDPRIQAFERQHPDTQIKYEVFPWQNRVERMVTAVAGGTAPDLCYLNEDNYAAFADMGFLRALDEFPGFEEIKADIKPSTLKALSWKGKLYVMPILQTTAPMFYNKKIFRDVGLNPASPPLTWDDLLKYCEKLTADTNADGKVDRWGFTVGLTTAGTWWTFTPWLYQAGGSYFTDDMKKATFNDSYGVEALEVVVKLYDRYVDPNDRSVGTAESIDSFVKGRAAMMIQGQQKIADFRRDFKALDFGVGPILTNRKQLTCGTAAGFGLFAQSKNPAAAAQWISFIANKENTLDFDAKLLFIPPRKSLDEPFKTRVNEPLFNSAVDESSLAKFNPIHPEWQAIMKQVTTAVQMSVLHKATPKEALDTAAVKSDVLLNQ